VLVVETARRVARQPAVESVYQEGKREIAFELGGAPCEDEVATLFSSLSQLAEKTGFAYPGLAAQPHPASLPAFDLCESAFEYAELVPAPDQSGLRWGHEARVTSGACKLTVVGAGEAAVWLRSPRVGEVVRTWVRPVVLSLAGT
jgi:hypothetical protein